MNLRVKAAHCVASLVRFSSSSSKAWLGRQSRDPFVKQRAEDSFRSRSAYKLLEIDEKYKVLRQTRTVVDLGASPGGWSEAAVRRMRSNKARKAKLADSHPVDSSSPHESSSTQDSPAANVIAVDLLPIVPIEGVHTIQGDFLSSNTHIRVTSILQGRPVDVVLSDMCENISGNRDQDAESSLQLCLAAFSFAKAHLIRPQRSSEIRRGVLIMKYFAHPDMDEFRKRVGPLFHRVEVFKPKSSRSDSSEAYLICIGWQGNPRSTL